MAASNGYRKYFPNPRGPELQAHAYPCFVEDNFPVLLRTRRALFKVWNGSLRHETCAVHSHHVKNGHVLLMGVVDTMADKNEAEVIIRSVPGVQANSRDRHLISPFNKINPSRPNRNEVSVPNSRSQQLK